MTRTGGLATVAAILLTVVLAIGLLYAYRSQSPAFPVVAYSALLNEVQQGRVRLVEIEDGRGTLTFNDGTRQQAILPDNGDALARAVQDHNGADPTHPTELRFNPGQPNPGISVVVVLLPVLFLALPILFAAQMFNRARAPQRYEALSRLADLRDRAVITEEEFQREKRRLLK